MVNGNLAYKKDFVTNPIRPEKTLNKVTVKAKNVTVAKKAKDSREMVRRRVTLLRIMYMAVIAFSATFMISKFVTVNDTAGRIQSLNKELASTRSYTSQRIFEMERSVDLSEVEEIASSRLGMQRPESYQMIYVDVEQEDVSEVTAGEVEGAKNELKSMFSKLARNIIELFSIK
ncbi:MAG: hypothetical protein J6N52_06615 [Clostridia bacterium]|nr:hypothetical protein [Clostridia bacterium]